MSLHEPAKPHVPVAMLSLGVTALAAVGVVWGTPTGDGPPPTRHPGPPSDWLQPPPPDPSAVRIEPPLEGTAPPMVTYVYPAQSLSRTLSDMSASWDRQALLGPIFDPAKFSLAEAGRRAVEVARSHAGVLSSSLRGHLAHFQAAGGETNNCADFVSAILQGEGLLSQHYNWVPSLEQGLRNEGYKAVPAQDAVPGDVYIQADRMHTQLVTKPGGQMVIGTNNGGRSYQIVSEGPPMSGGVYYHRQ